MDLYIVQWVFQGLMSKNTKTKGNTKATKRTKTNPKTNKKHQNKTKKREQAMMERLLALRYWVMTSYVPCTATAIEAKPNENRQKQSADGHGGE